jgi:hypothetical protein
MLKMATAALITISSVVPKAVVAQGGTSLALSGTGFLNLDTLSCQFGSKVVPASFYFFTCCFACCFTFCFTCSLPSALLAAVTR